MKTGVLKEQQESEHHIKAIDQELLQRKSSFHTEVLERKEVARYVLEMSFGIAYFIAKEHLASSKFS